MASIYKRGDTYYVKFYEKGRRVRRSLKTSKKAEALRLKEAMERELASGKFDIEVKDSPVDLFTEEYLKWAAQHKRRNTVALEKIFWTQFITFAKAKTLGSISPQSVERFKSYRLKKGIKQRSINTALKHLQAIFNYAIKLGYFSGPNPFQGIQRFKLSKNPPKYLKKEQLEKVLEIAEAQGRYIHMVFALGIFAGLRKNEIVNTRWEWIDFKRKVITLESSETFFLKDSESRSIPLHDRLASILKPHRESSGYLFNPDKETPGKNRYRYEFKRAFNTVLGLGDLEWVTPHILRHTFASQLAIAGVSLYKISKWLGHSDVNTTQIYAHLQTHDEDINRF